MEYDEEAAIAYVRQQLPEGSRERFDDDEILNVIDTVWDYYDENGFLDLDLDDDGPDELDEADLLVYVKKMMSKDRRSPLTTEDIEAIVKAELDYEDSIE